MTPRLGLLAGLCLLLIAAAPVAAANPTGPWTELADGARANFRWSIKAKRAEVPAESDRQRAHLTCLLADTSWQSGQLEYHRSRYRECVPISTLSASGPPLVVSGMQPSTGAPPAMSAVGMIFAPAARRVRITLAGGREKSLPLQIFDPPGKGNPGPGSFRFVAFAVHGSWCAERLVSQSATGRMLWDSGVAEYACGTESDPHFVAP
jgi:hypothetical protein